MSLISRRVFSACAGAIAVPVAMAALTMLLPAAPAQAQGQSPDLAIVGATVYTEPGTVLDSATILIRAGRIRAVGTNLRIPAGARRIDGTGKIVTAGLVEASSRLGLIEVSLEASTREGAFPGKGDDVVYAAYRTVDGYNPNSVAIPVTRGGGVTSAMAAPVGGLVSGTGAWVSLVDISPGSSPGAPSPIVSPAAAVYANLGEAALAAADGSRGMAALRLRELLDDARDYQRRRAAYERNQSRPMAAERLDLEALQPVLAGTIPLVVRAERRSDIQAALRIAADYRVRLVIEGGTEAWMLAPELAAARVGVLIDPTANLPASFDRIYVRDDNATVLAAAGVPVVISTLGGAANVRTLRQLAGIAVANGLSRAQALAAVTTVPANLFGVPRGRIRAGQVADLVLWSGDPFELSTRAEQVIIAGVPQSLESHQTLLRDRYRTLPRSR
ncbi:amidohydrolase family protein [Haliangium sp.]|uniref:amidohydrolase family protein n=1 Tax=Haliangium sp. TaxID=2663208 RepID=UPI003D0CEC2F